MSLLGEESTDLAWKFLALTYSLEVQEQFGRLFGTGRLFLYVGLLTGRLFGQRRLFEPGAYLGRGVYLSRAFIR